MNEPIGYMKGRCEVKNIRFKTFIQTLLNYRSLARNIPLNDLTNGGVMAMNYLVNKGLVKKAYTFYGQGYQIIDVLELERLVQDETK